MSRPRKPTALKKQNGSYNSTLDRDRMDSVISLDSIIQNTPECPSDFNQFSVKTWKVVWDWLNKYKYTTEVDVNLIVAYCREIGLYEESRIRFQQNPVIETDKGYAMPSPWYSIGNKALVNAIKLAGELGFTPQGRAKITMPKQENENPLLKFLND